MMKRSKETMKYRPEGYTCGVCGKTFKYPFQLGGHNAGGLADIYHTKHFFFRAVCRKCPHFEQEFKRACEARGWKPEDMVCVAYFNTSCQFYKVGCLKEVMEREKYGTKKVGNKKTA